MASERARTRSARHAASAVDEVGADRSGELGRLRRRGGVGHPLQPRLGRRASQLLRRRYRDRELPVGPRRAVAEHPGAARRGGRRGDPRHHAGGAAVAARSGVLPAARPGHGVHRSVPWHPSADRAVSGGLRDPRPRLLRTGAGGVVGHHRDRADLLGVHRRSAARGHGGRAPLATRRRPLDGPHARADAAHRRHPAGCAQGRAGAHERLRLDAERRRSDLGPRGRGCHPGGADRRGGVLQLHAVRRGGPAVRGDGAADDPPHRLRVGASGEARADGGVV